MLIWEWGGGGVGGRFDMLLFKLFSSWIGVLLKVFGILNMEVCLWEGEDNLDFVIRFVFLRFGKWFDDFWLN